MLLPSEIARHAPSLEGDNLFINGDFQIWQRGVTFTGIANTEHSADRWQMLANGTQVNDITQNVSTPGAASGKNESPYTLKHSTTSVGTGTYTTLRQQIEDVRTANGQSITISGEVYATNAFSLTTLARQQFGTGGSSSVLTSKSFGVIPATAWTPFEVTMDVPSISGKTIGAGSSLAVELYRTCAVNDIYFRNLKCEIGAVATPFVQRPLAQELAMCQRYYRQNGHMWGYMRSTTDMAVYETFPVQMRTLPSATLLTTTPEGQAKPYGTSVTGSGSTLVNSDLAAQSCTLRIGGFTATADVPAVLNENQVAFDAEL